MSMVVEALLTTMHTGREGLQGENKWRLQFETLYFEFLGRHEDTLAGGQMGMEHRDEVRIRDVNIIRWCLKPGE